MMSRSLYLIFAAMLVPGSAIAKGGIGAVFGALIGGAAGSAVGKAAGGKALTVDEALVRIASETNKQLPMAVDRDTRLDNISPGPGRQFTYNYTFVNSRSEDFDSAAWHREARPLLQKKVCTNADLVPLFKHGVTLAYAYRGKDGGHVGKVAISPSDCGIN
jgi:hypothetical protein